MVEGLRVRRITEDDWAQLRDIRLEMLRDSPTAYLETLSDAESQDEDNWRFRARRGSAGNENLGLVAEEPATGRWVAFMACFVDAPGRAHLVSVYVAPSHRGGGLAESMVQEVRRWARQEAAVQQLHLLVHEDNARARAFYARLRFVATGLTEPYALDPSKNEIEMAEQLDGSG